MTASAAADEQTFTPVSTSAHVVADSVSTLTGERLTTIEATMHRFVLAEFNTHRTHSRNSASSRAIPVEKQLAKVVTNQAFPLEWPAEQPGMQGGCSLESEALLDAYELFGDVWDHTTETIARYLAAHPDKSTRLHKSLINRLLEPFMWHTVIATSTTAGWENFFAQRCSPLAQPEIRAVAECMEQAYDSSTPAQLGHGHWHTPYVSWLERAEMDLRSACRVSAARCARVSYLTHDGVRDIGKDLDLYAKLVTADPPHWSPLEHVATPARKMRRTLGNFDRWHQLRHVGLPKQRPAVAA